MKRFPKKCLVDTNVPVIANLAQRPDLIPENLSACVLSCIDAVEHVVKRGGLVLDDGEEIFSEYRRHLSLKGQPGVGDRFMKWVHDNRWNFPSEDRVHITRIEDGYKEFPSHAGLTGFDHSDRKFIAVANAHSAKPPILQATDSKWWGWRKALKEVGISVRFICPRYSQGKFVEKMSE